MALIRIVENIATHGRWCGARTYPTVCRFCSEPVFYFQCNCGSKVFFDNFGDPWLCAEYLATVSPVKFTVERTYTATLRENLKKPDAFQIVRIDAGEDQMLDDVGVIREVLPEVDVAAKSGVSATDQLGMAFLGKLVRTKYGQLTVHTGDSFAGGLEKLHLLCRDTRNR